MKIRGWVYVLSNSAMPGLVKVGFSTKDPVLRVGELDGTGLPHPFIIEYDALVFEPRDVEQAVHQRLSQHHEAKEFFRIAVGVAVSAIRSEVSARGEKCIVEQINFSESGGNASHGICKICRATVARTDSRCPHCFAMLP